MPIERTSTQARANLAELLDTVTRDRDTVVIRRRNGEDVALIAADELEGLRETAHLLRSPANATRLLRALDRAVAGGGRKLTPKQLRTKVRLDRTT